MAITISLVEDYDGLRETLARFLNDVPGLRCVGAYRTGEEAVRKIPFDRPDVALVDINLPGMSGIECVAHLKEELPGLHILMLTMYEQSDLIFNSLRAGASGYLLKNTPSTELIQAIEEVHTDGAPISMAVARKIIGHFKTNGFGGSSSNRLTSREQQILEQLARGRSNREIGETLNIGVGTVGADLRCVYEKLHRKRASGP
jgi:DNA-binding NarL/FixJ family response regulator